MNTSLRRLSGKTTLTSGQRLKVIVALALTMFMVGLFGFEPTSRSPATAATASFAASNWTNSTPDPRQYAPNRIHSGADQAAARASGDRTATVTERRAATELPIKSLAALYGKIYSDTGQSLAGRTVELSHRSVQRKYVTVTNAEGHYSFPVVESPADYRLTVFGGAGHKNYQQNMTMAPSTAELNIFLESYRSEEMVSQVH
jgi:hypothetical protein